MPKSLNLTGKKFNRLLVMGFSHRQRSKRMLRVICDCGNEFTVETHAITSGKTKSCGCLNKERTRAMLISRNTTHNLSKSRVYKIWFGIMKRCYNPKCKSYKAYGESGILVDKKWHIFIKFFEDMGHPPSHGHSIERINNSYGYSKENCKWADKYEQANNRKNNRILKIFGESMTMKHASVKFKIHYFTLRSRIQRGWNHERAVTFKTK